MIYFSVLAKLFLFQALCVTLSSRVLIQVVIYFVLWILFATVCPENDKVPLSLATDVYTEHGISNSISVEYIPQGN